MKDAEGTEPSQKKAKSSQFVPGPGASSKSQHGLGVFQGDSSGGACGYANPSGSDQGLPPGPHLSGAAMPSVAPPISSGSAGATLGPPYGFNPDPFGSPFPSGGAMHSGAPPMSSGSAGPTPGAPYGFNPPPFGSHFPSGGGMPSGPPPMSSGSAGATQGARYHRAGYSVVISNGFLYHNGDDKGVVMIKSGTQFLIAIANGNSHGK